MVANEVVLSVQRLVSKYGKKQELVTWENILLIVEELLGQIEVSNEVVLSAQRLVSKYGKEQELVTWENVLLVTVDDMSDMSQGSHHYLNSLNILEFFTTT